MYRSVIEGFYGRSWSFTERKSFLCRLNQLGFASYCYAPKSDVFLRQSWRHPWPSETLLSLLELRQFSQEQSVKFEVGFSPFALVDDWNTASRQQLKNKIKELKQLNLNGLNVLFDDMTNTTEFLAKIQTEIVDYIADCYSDISINVCPSYYSFDPVLEEVFGSMPDGYLADFGAMLSQDFGVFWTGDKVISERYDAESIAKAENLLQRKPLVWDNSLANDGKKTSPFLKFHSMTVRQQSLPQNISGMYFNPMNQAAVAEQVLATFSNNKNDFESMLDIPIESFRQLLIQYEGILSFASVDEVTLQQKQDMLGLFSAYGDEPLANNIMAWLSSGYEFDPECLT